MNSDNKLTVSRSFLAAFIAFLAFAVGSQCIAADEPLMPDQYLLQPGDVLLVSVWKEEALTREVIVRPDGRISFPLVGEAMAAGNEIESLRNLIAERLSKYVSDPVVTVSVAQLTGNRIYVIGQVNRPGEFAILRNVDVMQALSMAGGTSTYAALNKIKILRRYKDRLEAIPFKYGEVEKGENLEQNIILRAGDVVVVP